MIKLLLIAIAAIVFLLAATVGGFFLYGPERLWERVGGPPDQGPVDFASLRRSPTPNDALACSPEACPSGGPVDLTLPVYSRQPSALMERLDATLAGDSNVSRVDDGSRPHYRRYVVRTPLLRFPDTVDAEASSAPAGTVLRLYSRSLLGKGDLGANRRRLEQWAAQIGR